MLLTHNLAMPKVTPISPFGKLGAPAQRALAGASISTLKQLTKKSEAEVAALHGIGPNALGKLRAVMLEAGLNFKQPKQAKKTAGKASEKIHDNPTDWVNKHIQRYIETDGKEGHDWQGVPALLLTTRGRKSGLLRRTALFYGQSGKDYVVVASKGGAPTHPAWYLNMEEDAHVEIQVGSAVLLATARVATGPERPTLLKMMIKAFAGYKGFEAKSKKSGREMPIVVLTPY